MVLSSKIFRLFVSSILILTVSLLALADTVRLKDGSIIKGRIVSFGGGKFIVTIGEGSRRKQLTYSANEVESIEFDSPISTSQNSGISDRNTVYSEPVADKPVIIPAKVVKPVDLDRAVSTSPISRGEKMQPIEWRIKVLADSTSNGWTNSGWVVRKGQRIRITGDGKIVLGRGKTSTASGLSSLADEQKLLKNVPTGALIAVIGDDNNDFIYIGSEREFTATRDGALFLGINEGYLEDNSGAFDVKIEIIPAGVE